MSKSRISQALCVLCFLVVPLHGQFTNARSLQGKPICANTPSDTQVLTWNAASNCWKPAAGGGATPPVITPSGNATQATPVYTCLDKTVVYSVDLTAASGTISVTLGTPPAHWIWTDVWGRETVTFAGTAMTTATVSVGPSGSETAILPAVSLKQATNTVVGFPPAYAPADGATAIVAQFVITSGGGTFNNASAGTYDLRVCGHAGRP